MIRLPPRSTRTDTLFPSTTLFRSEDVGETRGRDVRMQNVPLTVDRIIDHAANWHGGREIVSRDAEGRVTRTTYADIRADAKRVSNALAAEGIQPGDRVATMAWNGARHLAAWYEIGRAHV